MKSVRRNIIIVLLGVLSTALLFAGDTSSVWEYENSPSGVGWDLSMYEYLRPAFDDLNPGPRNLNSVEYARYIYLKEILAEPAEKAIKDLALVRRVTSLGDELSLEYQGENVKLKTFDFNVAIDLGILDLSFSLSVDRGTIAQKGLSVTEFRKAAENGELALDVSYHLLHRKNNVYAIYFDSIDMYINSLAQSISSLENIEGMEFTIEAIYTDVVISGLNTYALQPEVNVDGKYSVRYPFGSLLSCSDMSKRAAVDIEQAWNVEEKRLDDLKIQEKKTAYEEKLKARNKEIEEFNKKYDLANAEVREANERNRIIYEQKVKEAEENTIVEVRYNDRYHKNETGDLSWGLSSISAGLYYVYPDDFGLTASVVGLLWNSSLAVESSLSSYGFMREDGPGLDFYLGVGAYLAPFDHQLFTITLGVAHDLYKMKPLARLTWIPEIKGETRFVHVYLEASPYQASVGIRFAFFESEFY